MSSHQRTVSLCLPYIANMRSSTHRGYAEGECNPEIVRLFRVIRRVIMLTVVSKVVCVLLECKRL